MAPVVPLTRPANPLVNRDALVSEGHALIPIIARLADLDPTEVVQKASAWKGGSYVRLDVMPDDRLAHTIAALRTWARRLQGQPEPELPRARSPAEEAELEHERRKSAMVREAVARQEARQT